MTMEVRVPQLPESVADATLVAWHKKVGDTVARDENLADLETDKVVLEVPAPVAGVIKSLDKTAGTTVTSGELLAVIEERPVGRGSARRLRRRRRRSPLKPGRPTPRRPRRQHRRRRGKRRRRASSRPRHAGWSRRTSCRRSRSQAAGVTGGSPRATSRSTWSPRRPPQALSAGRTDRRVPMSRLRARIAQRLVEAQSTAALLTTFNEVDMQELMALRARYKEAFEKRHGVRLGFMSFFAKACIEALRRFPVVNASVEGSDIVYHEYYDIGMAVSTDRGLIVPVLRDADRMDFAAIEKAVTGFAERARSGTITIEELTGGTFSITNGGVFGSLMSTPILNAPQSAILGMHKIQERPVAVDGQVVIRPMMYLALTYDHRIIDGREAVQFLVAVKDALEDPARLLLQV